MTERPLLNISPTKIDEIYNEVLPTLNRGDRIDQNLYVDQVFDQIAREQRALYDFILNIEELEIFRLYSIDNFELGVATTYQTLPRFEQRRPLLRIHPESAFNNMLNSSQDPRDLTKNYFDLTAAQDKVVQKCPPLAMLFGDDEDEAGEAQKESEEFYEEGAEPEVEYDMELGSILVLLSFLERAEVRKLRSELRKNKLNSG